MTTLPALIDRVERELYDQFPPASEAAVDGLAEPFRERFGIDLPDAYRELLLRSDGVDADGLVIYSTCDANLDADEQRLGLVESNDRLIHGEHDVDTPLRFVGERDDTLLAHDTTDGLWKVVDRTGWEGSVDQTFDTFEAMVASMLQMVLD